MSWTQEYERRMRRFNLEIIAVAFIALVIVFRFISIDWSIFQK
jgi:hypothetical protein